MRRIQSALIGGIFVFLMLLSTLSAEDNRRPKVVTSFDDFQFRIRDEVTLLRIIENGTDRNLDRAIKNGAMRLKWNQQICLIDKDYILAVFVPEWDINPGSNPIVMILFNLDYKVQTWGEFDTTPHFESGCIVSPSFDRPETYFLTTSTNDYSGQGVGVYLQKYSLSAKGIVKSGGGYLDLDRLK